ncbi:MAG: exodeoxyribonuclease III [Candidatus Latescibacteria bacterium]|nr:exodeoxyribonuclease III [Candidatus Latescibacterota bacterium]
MRITTWNVNGLRAALRKGFARHVERIAPDVLLLQEIRALPEQLPGEWVNPRGWYVHWHPAERKGYSGVAIWSRHRFEVLGTGINEPDPEGRILQARVKGVRVVNVYLPSGSSSEDRQKIKEDLWMARFLPWAEPYTQRDEPVVLGGDFNIAHTEKDIFYARGNEKNSGFLPHERQWMTDLLATGWNDLVRHHFGDVHGPYSWWSNRGRARELDRGWRIDYLLGNAAVATQFRNAAVHREAGLTVSDHAPVSIDLECNPRST